MIAALTIIWSNSAALIHRLDVLWAYESVSVEYLISKVDTVRFLSDDQFGFRKITGTRDAIGTLRVLTERSFEVDRDVYVCFVDYEKAFDRVDWKKLMRVLRRLGVDYRDRKLIGNLYMGQAFTVRIEEEDSDPGIIGRGTRQGCPLSPLLFNIELLL